LAKDQFFEHDAAALRNGIGENLFGASASQGTSKVEDKAIQLDEVAAGKAVTSAVESWYGELYISHISYISYFMLK